MIFKENLLLQKEKLRRMVH